MRNFLFGTPYEYGLFARLRYDVLYWICGRIGHKIVNGEGWATPDTGGEEFWCSRCHQDWSVTYY